MHFSILRLKHFECMRFRGLFGKQYLAIPLNAGAQLFNFIMKFDFDVKNSENLIAQIASITLCARWCMPCIRISCTINRQLLLLLQFVQFSISTLCNGSISNTYMHLTLSL